MKTIEINEMEKVNAGDFNDIAGGLACGAAVASVFVNPFMAWIPAIGCLNYINS